MVAERIAGGPDSSVTEWPSEWEDDPARNLAIQAEYRRNLAFRNENLNQLRTQFPNKFVLIFDGGTVESFDTWEALGRFRAALDPLRRLTAEALICKRPRVLAPSVQASPPRRSSD